MANPAFREEQYQTRYAEHIAPINRLVDSLQSSQLWLPYVAPMYGGVHARLLSLLRDPGPKTKLEGGSGFLSMENDDPTAEAIDTHFGSAGISARDIVPWNAYPWYIDREPTAAELDAGVEPLVRLIELMPNLRVVMLHGRSAQASWKRLARRRGEVIDHRRLTVIPTYHPSRQAFWHRDPNVREQRREHLRAAFAMAARALT